MVLHIISSYSSTPLYKNLIEELDILGLPQMIYNPLRGKAGKHDISFKTTGSKIIYAPIINSHIDKLFYRRKVDKVLKDIEAQVDFSKIKLIHAHTWYSDGGVAYLLSLKYNIPYVIVVRNTDINLFQKYLIQHRWFGRKILLNANKIIFISTAYLNKVTNDNFLSKILVDINQKFKVIPNGVDPFWLENVHPKKDRINKPTVNILYIGRFVKGKNVVNLQKAIILLNKTGVSCILHLVGGGGSDEKEILKNIQNHKDLFIYHGKIYDRKELLSIMRKCDIFAMPSQGETFGLVYMESLLQGLPILYTRNEGIDGFYKDNIGEAVEDLSPKEISIKLKKIIDNYDTYSFDQKLFIRQHNWKNIAEEYLQMYSSILGSIF